ncbi:MAG TPA: ABC transporter substrate-binding protein [Geminicoccaceae bacterium]|nr:ABC transporter substrate-binding protein [Geminicoccaceae bacterium]
MHIIQSRRDFLATASLAAAAGVLGPRASLADEGPPETTTIRLRRIPAICVAPGYIADTLLRAEGFTDIRYIPDTPVDAVARGEIDFDLETAAWIASNVDTGQPITALAGVHVGCYELFAHEPIRAIGDLKGKRVGIPQTLGSSGHLLLAVIAAQVGLDPQKDIDWIISLSGDFLEVFAAGKVDAFLGFPPEPQELRARNVGRVILNTTTDQPWSHYFCCTAFGNREFVRAHPVATKRYLRAILKTADFCAAEPEQAAQQLVDAGFTGRYDYALQTLTEVPYGVWREYDPEDSMRFYALRLHEVGMIKSTPNAILAEGTDWRFLNELKRELKA